MLWREIKSLDFKTEVQRAADEFALACAADHKRKYGSTAVPVGS
jgi:hypothetical protein